MNKPKRPVDVIVWLRSEWYVRDLTTQDFDKAISDILQIAKTQEKETT
jgi:hypothetical protein